MPLLLLSSVYPIMAAIAGWPAAPDLAPVAETKLPRSDRRAPTAGRRPPGLLRQSAIPAECSPRSPTPALLRRRHTCHPTGLVSSPTDKHREVKRLCLPWDEFPTRVPEGCTSYHW